MKKLSDEADISPKSDVSFSFASFDFQARYQGLHVHQFQFLHH